MTSIEKPYVLYIAELIYLKVCEIKKRNPNFSNINALETFIGTKEYKDISNGKFHDEWIKRLKENNFIDKQTKKKYLMKQLSYLRYKKI